MPLTFKPQQSMTFATVDRDRARLMDYSQSSRAKQIIIDLSHVTQCDSAGLALLLECKRIALSMRKSCRIENMPDFMHSLAAFSGVEAIMDERQ